MTWHVYNCLYIVYICLYFLKPWGCSILAGYQDPPQYETFSGWAIQSQCLRHACDCLCLWTLQSPEWLVRWQNLTWATLRLSSEVLTIPKVLWGKQPQSFQCHFASWKHRTIIGKGNPRFSVLAQHPRHWLLLSGTPQQWPSTSHLPTTSPMAKAKAKRAHTVGWEEDQAILMVLRLLE